METRTYNVYPFEELPKESQEKALERYRDINTDDPYWTYDEYYEEIAKDYGITAHFKDLCYDIYGRLAFFSDVILEDKFYKLCKLTKSQRKHLDAGELSLNYRTSDRVGASIDVESSSYAGGEEELETRANKVLNEMTAKLFKALSEQYDYLTSDEAIKETFDLGEYLFTLEGEID